MRNFILASVFVLVFCVATFAQTDKVSSCPTISVTGEVGIPQPNEPITFVSSVGKEGEKYNLKYIWSVSNGEIVEGQGTLTLKVLQDDSGKNLTATVEMSRIAIGYKKQS